MQDYLIQAFKSFRLILWGASFYALYLNCFYAYYLLKGKKGNKTLTNYVGNFFSKKKGILLCEILLVLGITSSPFIFCHFENTNIGSFLEKESYREQYYVYIRSNNKQSKSYRCKADIYRGDYGYPAYTDEGEETFIIKGNGYFLEKVYWDNGGYLTFTDDDFLEITSSARIYPGKETLITDCHGDEYYVTLTTEKVKWGQLWKAVLTITKPIADT